MVALPLVFRDKLPSAEPVVYPAVFLLSLFASSLVVLPAPGVELVVASETGYVYLVGSDGQTLWATNLRTPVRSLAVRHGEAGPGPIAAGTDEGAVFVLSARGEVLGRWTGGSGAVKLLAADLAGAPALVVGDQAGTVTALAWP